MSKQLCQKPISKHIRCNTCVQLGQFIHASAGAAPISDEQNLKMVITVTAYKIT